MSGFNDHLYLAVNAFARHTPWLHASAAAFAKYGVILFGAAIIVVCLRSLRSTPRDMAAAVWIGLATLLAVAVNQPIGHAFGVVRPYVTHPHALVLVNRTSDFSFPSDHAVMAGAVAAGLIILSRRWTVVAVIGAVLMALARVYVGVHTPADVVAGLGVGAVVACVGWLAFGRILTHWVDALGVTSRRGAGRSLTAPGTRELPD